jgi:hypothetical protein
MLPSAKKRRENGAELASDFRRPDQRLPDASVHAVQSKRADIGARRDQRI